MNTNKYNTIKLWIFNYAPEQRHQINFYIDFYNYLIKDPKFLSKVDISIRESLIKASVIYFMCRRYILNHNQEDILECFQLDPAIFIKNNQFSKIHEEMMWNYAPKFWAIKEFTVLFKKRKACFYEGLDTLHTIRNHFQRPNRVLIINNNCVIYKPRAGMIYKLASYKPKIHFSLNYKTDEKSEEISNNIIIEILEILDFRVNTKIKDE